MNSLPRLVSLGCLAAILMLSSSQGWCRTDLQAIAVSGSPVILERLGKAWAGDFQSLHPNLTVTLSGQNSQEGIDALFAGKVDFAASTRSLKREEILAAREQGFDPFEIIAGYDGIAVAVNAKNPVKSLTLFQVALLFDGTLLNWSAVGGDRSPVRVVIPEEESGQGTFFSRLVLQGAPFSTKAGILPSGSSPREVIAADQNVLAFLSSSLCGGNVQALALSSLPGQEFLLPTAGNLSSGAYPLSRPLLLYARSEPSGAAKDFADFVVSSRGQKFMAESGMVSLFAAPGGLTQQPVEESQNATVVKADADRPVVVVTFRLRSNEPDDASRDQMRTLARSLSASAIQNLRLVGYTSDLWPEEINLEQSERMIRRVKEYLEITLSVKVPLEIQGRGSQSPTAPNDTFEGRRENRRVEIWAE